MALEIYKIASESQRVAMLLLDDSLSPARLRLWGDGYASETQIGKNPVTKPYVVYEIEDDTVENGLTKHKLKSDMLYVFDIYAMSGIQAMDINRALQSALNPYGFVSVVRHPSFDEDVKLFVAGFDFSYISLE